MKISELKAKLEELEKEYGDLSVAVQYRDNEGDLQGSEYTLRLEVKETDVLIYRLNNDTSNYERKVIKDRVLLLWSLYAKIVFIIALKILVRRINW